MTVPHGTVEEGVNVLYTSIALLCQTFLFGIFAVLVPYSTYVVKKKRASQGLGARTHWLLYCNLFVFALSAAFWAASVANLILRLRGYFIHPSSALAQKLDHYGSIDNAVVLINYIITDAIVVWRAWVLCRAESGRLLFIPVVLLTLTSLSVTATISLRLVISIVSAHVRPIPSSDPLTHAINTSQVAGLVLSLLTNLSSTTIVAMKTWKYKLAMRTILREAQQVGKKAEMILALLVESGFIYCFVGITVIISTFIHLPHGTLGDLFLPSAAQITGIYPTLVMIVVNTRLTMDGTVFETAESTTLNFASRPPHAPSGMGKSREKGMVRNMGARANQGGGGLEHRYSPQIGKDLEVEALVRDTDIEGFPMVHALDSCGGSTDGSDSSVPRRIGRKDLRGSYGPQRVGISHVPG